VLFYFSVENVQTAYEGDRQRAATRQRADRASREQRVPAPRPGRLQAGLLQAQMSSGSCGRPGDPRAARLSALSTARSPHPAEQKGADVTQPPRTSRTAATCCGALETLCAAGAPASARLIVSISVRSSADIRQTKGRNPPPPPSVPVLARRWTVAVACSRRNAWARTSRELLDKAQVRATYGRRTSEHGSARDAVPELV
jgi:hypothetical protein